MTVKDLIKVIPFATDLILFVGGETYEMKPSDAFHLAAYGDFVVDFIDADGETGETCEKYEVHIKMIPQKAGGWDVG